MHLSVYLAYPFQYKISQTEKNMVYTIYKIDFMLQNLLTDAIINVSESDNVLCEAIFI